MPDSIISLQVHGLEELRKEFLQWPDKLEQGTKATMKGATEILRQYVADYPPASYANVPPGRNGRWYVRGFGTRTVTGKAYPTSQNLGRSWVTEVRGVGREVRGILGTRVTYAPFVQDAERQAQFHRRRGWPTVQEALKVKADEIVGLFDAMIKRLMRRG